MVARCRCSHGKEAHGHFHRQTYCAVCGREKCPRWRRLWVLRDRSNQPLYEGDRVQLAGFAAVHGHVMRVMSATEALVYWGGHNLSITESVKLVQLSRDHEEEVSA